MRGLEIFGVDRVAGAFAFTFTGGTRFADSLGIEPE